MNKATSTEKSNKEEQILKITTWNVQVLNKEGKLKELVQEIEKYDIDILAVQEINTEGTAITNFKKYIWCIGSGEQNRLGTGLIIKEEHKDKIIDYRLINERLNVNKEWDSIRTTIEASTELLKPRKREKRKDWFDDECRKAVQE
ncbi:hypothetical protein ILUMI_11432 [Ignelater luminosus]|uniref:Endonuclease/exonuclease/phosphatase domain-containing protein n=1 Tax=Ignelater luminosus TaxID=2038154 RepID=A0A8K0CVZ9_IGNLU|nr:hypothetical protein ILUMI_11432 [Ignelater luminosus]